MYFIDDIKRKILPYVNNTTYNNLRSLNKNWNLVIPKLDDKQLECKYKRNDIIEEVFNNSEQNRQILNINEDLIPKRMDYLRLEYYYYDKKINDLIKNFKYLRNITFYNCRIINQDFKLPECLENVTFSYCKFGNYENLFDKIDLKKKLTDGIKNLKIESKLIRNKIINYPKNLKKLVIYSNKFNHEIDNLPQIEELKIVSQNFNKPLYNLPKSLNYIGIWSSTFNQPLGYLPNITFLTINCSNLNIKINNLPNSLENLKIFNNHHDIIEKLPINLKYLSLYNTKINNFNLNSLPKNLIELRITKFYFDKKINYYPSNLQRIYFTKCNFNNNVLDNLPKTLKFINIDCCQNLNKVVLPSKQTILKSNIDVIVFINEIKTIYDHISGLFNNILTGFKRKR